MLAENTKLLNQESSRRKATSVQSISDKMSRLTCRKVTIQKPCMINEYGSSAASTAGGERGEKAVNHSNSKYKSSTNAEGKRDFPFTRFSHTRINKFSMILTLVGRLPFLIN